MMPRDLYWLRTTPIAHRGLHDAAAGIVENSLSAFRAAMNAGYAIELDLRETQDGEAIVFHDETLERLTDETGEVRARSAEFLKGLRLKGSPDRIPDLADVLALIKGKVPLLLELKAWHRHVGTLEARTAALLERYTGPVAVQSFNPLTLRWFRAHATAIPRGFLSMRYTAETRDHLPLRTRFALRHLLVTPMIRPQFIAYDVRALPALAPCIARLFGLPLIAWTVKSEEDRRISAAYADNIIFEGFRAPFPQTA